MESRHFRLGDGSRYALPLMLNRNYIVAALVALALLFSHAYAQGTDTKTTKSTQRVASKTFAQSLFAKTDEIVLMSHDGRWEGTDNDLELRLRRDGSVLLIDYGYAISRRQGRYNVKKDGTIVITPTGSTPWLPMPCLIEKGMLVIRPPGKDVLFAAARKVGIAEAELTDEAYQESYDQWPLRQIVQRKDGVTKR